MYNPYTSQYVDSNIREQSIAYLMDVRTRYDALMRLFPAHTCGIRVNMENEYADIINVNPSPDTLVQCIRNKERNAYTIYVELQYGSHITMLWFDTINHIINRYDTQINDLQYGRQAQLDRTLASYFEDILPGYVYIGNTLPRWRTNDYFIIYAIKRIYGKNDTDANREMLEHDTSNMAYNQELINSLAYRLETGS